MEHLSAAQATYHAAADFDDALNWRPPTTKRREAAPQVSAPSDAWAAPPKPPKKPRRRRHDDYEAVDVTYLLDRLSPWHRRRTRRIKRDLRWLDKKGRKHGIPVVKKQRRWMGS
jgi:hypothetical protein